MSRAHSKVAGAVLGLCLAACALLLASAPAPAATVTVSPEVVGRTPAVLGYNFAHFMPGSNAADWWRYSGVKHVRVFMPRNGIEFSDDLPGHGDGVTTEQQFFERRAALRADPLTRVASPSSVPEHLRAPFIGWSYLETKYRRDPVGGFNRYIVDPAFTTLRGQGVEILMQLSAYLSSFPITSTDDWAGNWELWQHYYFQAYYLAWKYDVARWSAFNEPNHSDSQGITVTEWLRRTRLASDAVQSAIADVNRDHGKTLVPRVYAPTTAGANQTLFNDWGLPALQQRTLRIDGTSSSAWANFHTYSWQVYTATPSDFTDQVNEWRSLFAAALPGQPRPPLAVTEFNVRIDFDEITDTLDTPAQFAPLAAGFVNLAGSGADELFLFKFGQTPAQANPANYPVQKLGTHYVNNDTGTSVNPYGGITRAGEAWRLFHLAAAGARPRLAFTKSSGLGSVDFLVTRDPVERVTYVYSVNRGTTAVTLDYNVSALGLAQDNRVLIHEVSTAWHGGVRFLTRINAGRIAPPGNSQPGRSVWLAVIPEREQAFQFPEENPVRSVPAVADATLRDGAFRATPEGASTTLAVRDDATTADGRAVATVQFDLSTMDLRELDRAILTLWTSSTVNGTAAQAHVYGLAGHTFDETAATWSATTQLRQNVPAGPRIEHNVISGDASTILVQGQLVANSTTPAEKHLDVTEFVRSQIASGSRFSFFVVQENRWDTAIDGRSPSQIVTGSGDIQGAGLDIVSREGGNSTIPGPRLRIIRRISELDLWRRANFGTTVSDGIAADLADPDSDGAPNLLEYALGTNPQVPSETPTLRSQISDSRLEITFLRLRAELTYTVEASTDLTTWTTLATNPGAPGEEVTVTDLATLPNTPRRFLRLRVTIP